MVPNGWVCTTFDKHIDCLTGFAFKSSNYSTNEGDIKLLRGDNIEPGNLRWKGVKYWPVTEYMDLERYHLKSGDFVIAMDRTWVSSGLKVAEVKSTDTPCLLVQRVARIRAKNTLEQSLLRQYFSAYRFEQYVKSVQTATAVPHISPNDIKEFPLLLPPRSEQKKIAKILSSWDKAITTTELLLDNSQQQKKALMQQLLTGKKRLRSAKGQTFTKNWEHGHLYDLAKISKGKALSSKNLKSGSYPVVAGGKTSPYSHAEYTHENVITVSASGAYAGYVAYYDYKIWASDCSVVTTKQNNLIQFVFQLMLFNQAKIYTLQSGGAQPHIYPKDLNSLKVMIPSIQEQQKIATVLSIADLEIEKLQQKLAALKQEKKALMQQLLTGKRRVILSPDMAEVANA